MSLKSFLVLLALWPSLCGVAYGQWVPDGAVVCDTVGAQRFPAIAADARGGAVIAWTDNRKISEIDVHVQRVDGAGYVQWTRNGVPVCDTSGDQGDVSIVSDGSGGAIVFWRDARSALSDIYAQRVDSSGNLMWQEDGVAVCTAAGAQSYLDVAEDGRSGAIVAWDDNRAGQYDIYAQRIDVDGNVLWDPDGVPVCTVSGSQMYPRITTDDRCGAIIAWQDGRTDYNVYVQRVDSSGLCRWASDGVPVCTAVDVQEYPVIASDGAGGAVVTWADKRIDFFGDIYASRVDSGGTVRWSLDGIPVCTLPVGGSPPNIVDTGVGTVVIVWVDGRDDPFGDVYAQCVDTSGQARWTSDGIPLSDASNEQRLFSHGDVITPDGLGGAIVAWTDLRSGVNLDIYAQRVDSEGQARWDSNGVAVCLAWAEQHYPCLVSDGQNGAIISWLDGRSAGDEDDIYAQKVDSAGIVGTAVEEERGAGSKKREAGLICSLPNPFSQKAQIRYQVPDVGQSCYTRLKVYDLVGRVVRVLVDEDLEPGAYSIVWDGRNDQGQHVVSGVYFCRLNIGGMFDVQQVVYVH